MSANDLAACGLAQAQSSLPLLLVVVAVVYGWVRFGINQEKKLLAVRMEASEETASRLGEEARKVIEALKASHASELQMLRDAKGVVWIHFDEQGERYVCPGCGMKLEGRESGSAPH